MPQKQTEPEQKGSWLDDLNMESVDKVAELNIKPQLKINLNESVRMQLLNLPEKVKFADGNEYHCVNVLVNGVEKQFNCEARSFRFSLAVLLKKFGASKILESELLVSKKLGNTAERSNVPLYDIVML